MKVAIQHYTAYHFDRPTILSPHILRLRPAPHCRMPIESYKLSVSPTQHFIHWQQDPFANYLARLVFTEKTSDLIIDVKIIADMSTINPFDFFIEDYAVNFPFIYDGQLKHDLAPYLQVAEAGPHLLKWLKQLDQSTQGTVDFLVMINQHLQQTLSYTTRLESGVQNCEETLSKKSASCRDSTWLLIQLLRHLGLAARFVSGYQIHLPENNQAQEQKIDDHFGDLHAWAEVFIPGAGWIGLDPSSGLFAASGYIPLACTPDPHTAAPVTGTTTPCEVRFEHFNKVSPVK